MELIILIILSYGAIIIILELLKDYYSIYINISLLFTVITLIIGVIIFSLIHKLLKKHPNKKNEILVKLIQLFNIIILITGFSVSIIVIVLESVISSQSGIIHLHIMLFFFLACCILMTIIFFVALRRSPFIKEKETETTYGIPPKHVKRTKKQRVDLKNIKNFLDSYEELINDNPNGISDLIMNDIRDKISEISGYYSKLNDKYKKKFKNIIKFLESREE